MRLTWATQSLILAISGLFTLNDALPMNENPFGRPDLVARREARATTWSVVPIDGGGPGGGVPVTVTQTVVHTVAPTTAKTTVSATNTVIVTQTVSIVPIQPQPTTIVVTYTPTTTSSSSTSTAEIYTSDYSPPSPVTTPTALSSWTSVPYQSFSIGVLSTTTFPISPASTASITSLSSIPTYLPTESSSSKTYDDGMWHTTYPPWNGTALVRRHPRPQMRQIA
ncbi:hypothetical protein V8F20_005504 [Naviculisporaceae sp. PSN 640]